jgi:protein-tyrosine phosphatase
MKKVSALITVINQISRRLVKRLFILPVLLWSMADISSAQKIQVVNLENQVVRKFMSHGPYSGFGTENSYFENNEEFPSRFAFDKPESFEISWAGNADDTYTVTLRESRNHRKKGNTVLSETVNGNSFRMTNLIPQRYYTYTVKKGSRKVLSGKIRTDGHVRMLEIRDCVNARDLGGWSTFDGRTVRYGLLFRTGSIDGEYNGDCSDNCPGARCRNPIHESAQSQIGDPARYTLHKESVDALEFIGIDADLDLRGITGEGLWGNQCMTHTRSLGITKIPGADYCQVMTDIALHNPFDDPAVVKDVDWIIQELKKGRHVAFHCRSGADRTGAVAMIIEALLGVRAGEIALDYELTSLSSEGTGQTRSAKNVLTGGYGFYGRGFTTIQVDEPDTDRRLQKQAYIYLNSTFDECSISKTDLDWFVSFMLE